MIDSRRRYWEKGRFWLNSRYAAVAKWAILLGILYLVARLIDLRDVVTSFAKVSPLTCIGFVILILFSKFFYAFRWQLICANGLDLQGISTWLLLRINLLSEFVGIAIPSSLGGEAVRILKLSLRTGAAARPAASVVADRLLGVIGMGLVVLVLVSRLGLSITQWLPRSVGGVLAVAASGMGGLVIVWILGRDLRDKLPRAIQQLGFDSWLLMVSVLLTVSGHMVFAIAYYLLFREIQPLSFLTVAALVLTAQLARSIPVSLLGIGLNDGSLVALAGLVGTRPESALAVVVIALGARYLFAISGLLIELVYDGKGFLDSAAKRSHVKSGAPQ